MDALHRVIAITLEQPLIVRVRTVVWIIVIVAGTVQVIPVIDVVGTHKIVEMMLGVVTQIVRVKSIVATLILLATQVGYLMPIVIAMGLLVIVALLLMSVNIILEVLNRVGVQ